MLGFIFTATLVTFLFGDHVFSAASMADHPAHLSVPRQICVPVTFQIQAQIQTSLCGNQPNPNNETDILLFVDNIFSGFTPPATGTQMIQGMYTMDGTYCRPNLRHGESGPRDDTLQILVHSITQNRTMWTGYDFGNQYNWHAFANEVGYHTLAIDRLGHGTNPKNLDPFQVIKGDLQVELLHQLITMIRFNTAGNPLGRNFKQVAYVGHSFGAFLGIGLARRYPADVNALILTGYSTSPAFNVIHDLSFSSAATLQPKRFQGVPLGHVATSNLSQREAALYAGQYDQRIAAADWAYADTVTDGEIAGLKNLISQPAAGYKGPVMIVTGVEDKVFYQPPIATCMAVLDRSRMFFPDASVFQYAAIENTGHCLTLHYSAPETFARVHTFLKVNLGW